MITSNLRFYCQKILPLVYDDSLSYYEVVCKVASKLNEFIDWANTEYENNMKQLYEDIEKELKDWVNTNFNNYAMKSMYLSNTETIRFYMDD